MDSEHLGDSEQNNEDDADNFSRHSRDPFQLELLDAVKRRQKKMGAGLLSDSSEVEVVRHNTALDLKMEKFLANKQSPYRSQKAAIESNSERRPQDSSPGTGRSTNKLSCKQQQQDSEWIKSKGTETYSDNDEVSDEEDVFIGSDQQKIMTQNSNKPARPGLVKRPAFNSENPDNDEDAKALLLPLDSKKNYDLEEIEKPKNIKKHDNKIEEIGEQLKTNRKAKSLKPSKHVDHPELHTNYHESKNDTNDDSVFDREKEFSYKKKSQMNETKLRRFTSKRYEEDTDHDAQDNFGAGNNEHLVERNREEVKPMTKKNTKDPNHHHGKMHLENERLRTNLSGSEKDPASNLVHRKENHLNTINFDENSRNSHPTKGKDIIPNQKDLQRHHSKPQNSALQKEMDIEHDRYGMRNAERHNKKTLSGSRTNESSSDEEDNKSRYSHLEKDLNKQVLVKNRLDSESMFKSNKGRDKLERFSDDNERQMEIKLIETKNQRQSLLSESGSETSDYSEDDMIIRTHKAQMNLNSTSDHSNQHHIETSSRHKRASSLGSMKQHGNASVTSSKTYHSVEDNKYNLGLKSKNENDIRNKTDGLEDSTGNFRQYSLRKSGSLGSMLQEQKNANENSVSTKNDRDRRRKSAYDTEISSERYVETNKSPDASNRKYSAGGKNLRMQRSETSTKPREQAIVNSSPARDIALSGTAKGKGRPDSQLPKKGPVKANLDLDVARSAAKKTPEKSLARQKDINQTMGKRSLSFTNISNIRPKSMHLTNDYEDKRKQVIDSSSLRDQIYYDWLQNKTELNKAQITAKRDREREIKEEMERENKDKMMMSKKAFEAWQTKKDEDAKKKYALVAEKKKQEKEKLDELKQKKMDSEKYFASWKSRKDEHLIENHRKKKEQDKDNKRKEFQEKQEKLHSAKKVFDNWKARKDELLKEKVKEKKTMEKTQRMVQYEKQEKKRKAEKVYQHWKEEKQHSPRQNGPTLVQRAWCPSSRNSGDAIPGQVKPVIQRNPPNRSRTMSATVRL